MRFSFIHEIFYYTQLYVMFFIFYQFTGVNSNIDSSAGNLAASVVILAAYIVWFIFITYIAVNYKDKLNKIPQKYKFLVYE